VSRFEIPHAGGGTIKGPTQGAGERLDMGGTMGEGGGEH
jgi:hypothetical protein